MKFIHLSDLHFGRLLHRYSLEEEQSALIRELCRITREEKPDAVLIAGDVYDRGIPPVYATQLLDSLLAELVQLTTVCMISGNHDSAERLSFLSGPLTNSGLHISPVYDGDIRPVTLMEEAGPVDIWLLPFVKAATVRACFPEEKIENTHDAVACAIRHMTIDPTRRNVLVAHQFVAGGALSGSEEAIGTADYAVGGSDMVDASVFAPFDYTALGHIHRAQRMADGRIRYCGTPMAYDFSECRQDKTVTVLELHGDRTLDMRTIPLAPPRRLVELRGSFADLTGPEAIRNADRDAYTHIILTDEEMIPDVMNRLRQVYPRITHLDWDNMRTQHQEDLTHAAEMEKHTPDSLFADFFRRMLGAEMNPAQEQYLSRTIKEIWEGEE